MSKSDLSKNHADANEMIVKFLGLTLKSHNTELF